MLTPSKSRFQVGTRRIYPGYERCLSDIKAYIGEFIHAVTDYDIHGQAMGSDEEPDSRDTSPGISEDEDYSDVYQSSHWAAGEESSGIEELTRVISHCKWPAVIEALEVTIDPFCLYDANTLDE